MFKLNAALVSLKLEKYGNVLHQCDEALEIDQRCQKALFRLGSTVVLDTQLS